MTAESFLLDATQERGEPATVLALHCFEESARAAFDETIGRIYASARIAHVTLPGGAWGLARAAELTEGRIKRIALGGRSPAREAIEAMLESGFLRHVLLLGHQDCAWYGVRFPRLSAGDLVREQGADMLRARDEIQRWAPSRTAVQAWLLVTSEEGMSARRL